MGVTTEKHIWYLAREGKRYGPITDGEMRKLMELGHLKGDDLVWRPGYQDWRKAINVFSTFKLDFKIDRTPSQRPGQVDQRSEPSKADRQKASEEVRKSIASESSQLLRRERSSDQIISQPSGPLPKNTEEGTLSKEEEILDTEEDEENTPLEEVRSKSLFKKILHATAILVVFGTICTAGYLYSSEFKIGVKFIAFVLSTKKDEPSQKALVEKNKRTETAAIEPYTLPKENGNARIANDVEDEDNELTSVDRTLQKSSMWALLKEEFPDWYHLQMENIKKIVAEQKDQAEVNAKLAEALVALRRQKAQLGLAASTDQFQKIASTFISHLSVLEKKSAEDCFGYIGKGEMTPYAISMTQNPTEGGAFHIHMEAIMRAIVEGEKTPIKHEQPKKSDYSLLVKQLGNLGWSEADIQLFANPQTLSNAPPAQVCKMVREWFTAHLGITDSAARGRLLHETLRPIIAG